MAEKIRRQALSIQENELLSVEVRKYPCLYDKSKKEYRDKIVVANVNLPYPKTMFSFFLSFCSTFIINQNKCKQSKLFLLRRIHFLSEKYFF